MTQHHRLAVRCPSCGTRVVAPVPEAARGTLFGPRLHVVATYLKTFQASALPVRGPHASKTSRWPAALDFPSRTKHESGTVDALLLPTVGFATSPATMLHPDPGALASAGRFNRVPGFAWPHDYHVGRWAQSCAADQAAIKTSPITGNRKAVD